MTITLKINGVNRTSSIIRNSLNKSDVLNEKVDTLSFAVDKYGNQTYAPSVNDTVELLDTGVTIFKGLILTVDKSTDGHSVVRYDVECVDNAHFLNRTLVTEIYTNTTINAIIANIISTYAPTFTITGVVAPVPVKSITFNRISVSEALGKLSRLSNYSWYVDYTNDIHFFAKNTELAPFSITDNSNNYIYESLQVSEDISQLRNSVFIEGGEIEGEQRTETFTTDGVQKFFKLTNKFSAIYDDDQNQILSVAVNGVQQTIGVSGLNDESSFNVLWDYNGKSLAFANAPANGTLTVTGLPLYPILVQEEDPDSIVIYGRSEFAKVDKSISTRQEAVDFAIAELEAYANKISESSFATYTPGLRSGQVITVNSAFRGINEDFLIQRVTFRMVSQTVGEYRVELATLRTITLIDFLISQLRVNGTILADSDEDILHKYKPFTETISIADAVTVQALNYPVVFRLGEQAVTGFIRPFALNGSRLS